MKRIILAVLIVALSALGCAQMASVVDRYVPGGGSVVRVAGAAGEAMKELPPEEDIYIGRMVSARLIARWPLNPSASVQQYVNLVGTVVAAHSDRPDIPFRFGVLDSPEVNAMSAPGGYVFITTGLLRLLRNEDELAAVLGHEIAHVAQRHGIRMIEKALWQKVGVVAAREGMSRAGAPSQLLALADEATNQIMDVLLKGGYDRRFEYEADKLGRLYAARSGYDPRALTVVINRLRAHLSQGGSTFASFKATHPAPAQRLTELGSADVKSVSTPAAVAVRAARFKQYVR